MPLRPAPASNAARPLAMLLQIVGLAAANHVWTQLLAVDDMSSREIAALTGTLLASILARSIFEELVFRGAIHGLLRSRFGPAIAIGGGALLFGVAHGPPPASVVALLLGLQLGAVRECFGLGTAIAAHVASNLVWAVAMATAFEASPAPLFLGAAGVLAGIAIAALAQSMRRRTLAADRM